MGLPPLSHLKRRRWSAPALCRSLTHNGILFSSSSKIERLLSLLVNEKMRLRAGSHMLPAPGGKDPRGQGRTEPRHGLTHRLWTWSGPHACLLARPAKSLLTPHSPPGTPGRLGGAPALGPLQAQLPGLPLPALSPAGAPRLGTLLPHLRSGEMGGAQRADLLCPQGLGLPPSSMELDQ